MTGPCPATIDEYLNGVENESFRASLQRLREVIREEAPNAEEAIGYGMPTFKLNGNLVHFAAFKNHCSFFPGGVALNYVEQLKDFKIAKGTIQFTPEKPLPEDIVRKIVRDRIADNLAKQAAKKAKPRP